LHSAPDQDHDHERRGCFPMNVAKGLLGLWLSHLSSNLPVCIRLGEGYDDQQQAGVSLFPRHTAPAPLVPPRPEVLYNMPHPRVASPYPQLCGQYLLFKGPHCREHPTSRPCKLPAEGSGMRDRLATIVSPASLGQFSSLPAFHPVLAADRIKPHSPSESPNRHTVNSASTTVVSDKETLPDILPEWSGICR
jgi:hypothetical protein